MNYRHTLTLLVIAFGLAACTSYPSSYRDRAVYSDGSYYSRAGDGYGDYYYAPQRSYYDYPGYYGYGPSYFSYSYGDCWRYRGCSPWGFSGHWGPYSRSGLSIFYRQRGWSGSYWGPYSNRGYRTPRHSRPAPRPRMTPDNDRRDFRRPRSDMRRPGMDREGFQPRRERAPERSVPIAGSDPGNRIFHDRQPASVFIAPGNGNARMRELMNTRADHARPEAMPRNRFEPRPSMAPQQRPVAVAQREDRPSDSGIAPRASRSVRVRLPEVDADAVP